MMQLMTKLQHPIFHRTFTVLVMLSALTQCSILTSSGLKHAKGISFSAPHEWKEIESHGESDKAFKLPSGSTASITSSCQGARQISLENLTKDLLLGARKVKIIHKDRIIVANTEALFSHVNATVDGQAFQLLFVVLKKDNCVFDFTLVSTQSIGRAEIEAFLTFAKSLNYGQS